MGKTIVDEDMRFNIIVNGNSAQKELYDLEKRNRALKDETKLLTLEKKKLEAQERHLNRITMYVTKIQSTLYLFFHKLD